MRLSRLGFMAPNKVHLRDGRPLEVKEDDSASDALSTTSLIFARWLPSHCYRRLLVQRRQFMKCKSCTYHAVIQKRKGHNGLRIGYYVIGLQRCLVRPLEEKIDFLCRSVFLPHRMMGRTKLTVSMSVCFFAPAPFHSSSTTS